jgi:hypothetical protein
MIESARLVGDDENLLGCPKLALSLDTIES